MQFRELKAWRKGGFPVFAGEKHKGMIHSCLEGLHLLREILPQLWRLHYVVYYKLFLLFSL